MGRPSEYTPETALAICDRLTNGQSLREICRADDMPDKSTVFRWLSWNEQFRDQYARAKEAGIEALAEDLLDIADDSTNDWVDRQFGETTVRVVDNECLQRSRLRVDTRKWLLSKLAPKKYGDKLQHSGDPDAPLGITIVSSIPRPERK
jgi:hypothetical protein